MGYADRWEKKTPGDRIVADRAELEDRISADLLIIAETSPGDQLEKRGLQYLTGMDGITCSRLNKPAYIQVSNLEISFISDQSMSCGLIIQKHNCLLVCCCHTF